MKSSDVREKFLSYFEGNGHKRIASSSLIPRRDPTLMFTNAGMNQFKNVFLGKEDIDYKRAATCQKCCRVSGKHNDFEMVGKTPKHHTFFEMLGNFSFGDYFKKRAIEYAYELLVKEYGFPVDRLIFTVFKDDDEAYDLWRKHIGVPEERILRYDEKENFWSMGETGPCGPCSEIHYDFGPEYSKDIPNAEPSNGGDRFVELWNLVFMQYNKTSNGKMEPLAAPSVDTGAGLERIAAVLQGKDNNYHSDLFMPLIDHMAERFGSTYEPETAEGMGLRVMADHVRAATFLISDGLLPSNEGRGYVLRRIIRRGIRFARKMGKEEPVLYESSGFVISQMKSQYPELEQSREFVARVLLAEEERFSSTIAYGMNYFLDLSKSSAVKKAGSIPGKEVFKLYDTYGLPVDFTRDLADEMNLKLDEKGFEAEMEKQRARARNAWKGSGGVEVSDYYLKLNSKYSIEFIGYDQHEVTESEILAILKEGKEVKLLKEREEGEIILDRTPFYGESGGQTGDSGIISNAEGTAFVNNTLKPAGNLLVHKVTVSKGELKTGNKVSARVNENRRKAIMRNHTATHILQAALRNDLGAHIKQAGSLVAPDRLRFDFTHFSQVGDRELQRIENFVNSAIMDNIPVEPLQMKLDDAIADGAIALFDEKYSDKVRMISIEGISKELCGGTHVSRTGDIGIFKIISESSIAAGVRRIEAVTGAGAFKDIRNNEDILKQLAVKIKGAPEDLPLLIDKLIEKSKNQEKELKELRLKAAEGGAADSEDEIKEIAGVKTVIRRLDQLDMDGLRNFSDRLKNRLKSCIIVLGAAKEDKASLIVSVSKDLTGRADAVSLIRKIAKYIEGGGGGRPDMAQAGGNNPGNLNQALKEAERILEEELTNDR